MLNVKSINNSFVNNNFYNYLLLDEVSLYSTTSLEDSNHITNLIEKYMKYYFKMNKENIVVTDATSGVGGNAISFAKKFKKVNAIEIDHNRVYLLGVNITLHDVKNINIYNKNYIKVFNKLVQDVVFIDAPWGGRNYKFKTNIKLLLSNQHVEIICNKLENTKMMVLKVPLNFNFNFFFKKIKYKKVLIHKLSKMFILFILNIK